jgi:uncharacterized membrane protein
MSRRRDSPTIRWAVPLLLLASCAGATAVSTRATTVPALALGSHVVLALQLALLFFYGSLLLLVPLIRALDGDLPVELTLRGARWSEQIDGFGGEVLKRQDVAEERGDRNQLELAQEVRRLRERLDEADRAQRELSEQAIARIVVLEEKV